jgi:acyl-CoA thioesterase FadM
MEHAGVFGPHDTDINQYVFTGVYVRLLEDHAAMLVCGDGADAGQHVVERVALVFHRPFAAGARYTVRGALHRAEDRTLALAAVHPVTEAGTGERPAVSGRVEGWLASGGDDGRAPG